MNIYDIFKYYDLEKLRSGLGSTINYIEASRDGQTIEYLITPDKTQGVLTVSCINNCTFITYFF